MIVTCSLFGFGIWDFGFWIWVMLSSTSPLPQPTQGVVGAGLAQWAYLRNLSVIMRTPPVRSVRALIMELASISGTPVPLVLVV